MEYLLEEKIKAIKKGKCISTRGKKKNTQGYLI